MAESEHSNKETGAMSFAFTAQAADGSAVTDRIKAHSTEQAWAALDERGYTEIELLDNEGTAIHLDDAASRGRLVFTAAEEQAMRRHEGLARKILGNFLHARNITIWLPLLAWLIYNATMKGWSTSSTTLPAALLATYLIWFAWANVPLILYNLALEASTWHRWVQAERHMQFLGKWKKWFKTPLPEHELLFRIATAEAGQGRLDAALARVAHLEQDESLAAGFYFGRLSSLYYAAGNFQKVALCQHEARKRHPTTAATIDLAVTLARRLDNARGALALIGEIDAEKQPGLVKAYLEYCHGIIAVNKGEAAAACGHLEECLTLSRAFVGAPLMQGLVLDARAFYALALAAMGRKDEAKVHYMAAKAMLEAKGDLALLGRCKAVLE